MRDDEFRTFVSEQWAWLLATAYLVTPDRQSATGSAVAGLRGMRPRGHRFTDHESSAAEALQRTVRAALGRPAIAGAVIPTGDTTDVVLVTALRGLPPLVRAVIALHYVRAMRPDAAGAMLGMHPGTVIAYRDYGVAYLARSIGTGPDEVYTRLSRLAAAAAAAAGPAPFDALAHRNRGLVLAAAGVALLVTVVGTGTVLIVRHAPRPVPVTAGDPGSMGVTYHEGAPRPVPAPPFTPVYENVAVRIPNPEDDCGHTYAVSLHDPGRVGSYADGGDSLFGTTMRGDIVVEASCDGGTGRYISARAVYVRDRDISPGHCAELLTANRDESNVLEADVMCLVVEADPARGRPLLLVRLVIVNDLLHEDEEWTATAWTGAGTTVQPATAVRSTG
jgi:hypothetical protein